MMLQARDTTNGVTSYHHEALARIANLHIFPIV